MSIAASRSGTAILPQLVLDKIAATVKATAA
jgi:hypothetical protein